MAPMRRVYLDHHATTPLLPSVREAMEPYLAGWFGNASNPTYVEGEEAAAAVEEARGRVAALVDAEPREVVFTSGATESDNLAIKGTAWAEMRRRNHVVTCAVEHAAVLEPVRWLARHGFEATVLPVDGTGRVDPADVAKAVRASTLLVSIQMANGEIGTIQDVSEIGSVCRERGVAFHVDAAQAVGRTPVSFRSIGCNLLALSAHKIYGPKGVGALVVRRGTRLEPLLHGGGQEGGRRSGTANVAGIVGLGAACAAGGSDMAAESARVGRLRDRLWGGIEARIPDVRRNGSLEHGLPNNLSVSFRGVYGQALAQSLRFVAVSTGSACSSSNPEPSHVLRAIGLPDPLADGTLRFGLGRSNGPQDIDDVVDALVREVRALRSLAPSDN